MNSVATISQPVPQAVGRGGKFLTFALGSQEYALEILKVREIVRYVDVTAVPLMSASVKGVINLRGQVIPVIDLRARFGMPPQARTDESCIIVVEFPRAGRKLIFGVVADRVSEVLDIPSEQIEDPPAFGGTIETDFILGLGKMDGSIKILLNIERVLGAADALHLTRFAERAMAQEHEGTN